MLLSLDTWLELTERARWRNLVDLWQDFKSADQVGRRTVFNIAQNRYRLIARRITRASVSTFSPFSPTNSTTGRN
jgi:mRNA-degrading endonuclease HigB of HigAB toxin-antitoxin module